MRQRTKDAPLQAGQDVSTLLPVALLLDLGQHDPEMAGEVEGVFDDQIVVHVAGPHHMRHGRKVSS